MKFISVTGIDKSGKSSLINELYKRTNGLVYVMDRDISTWNFFNEFYRRIKNEKVYKKEYKNKLDAFRKLLDLAVILEVNEKDWKERCKKHNEQELIGSFEEHSNGIRKSFDKARYPNVLRLNTSEKTLDECVKEICKRIGFHNVGESNANK